MGILVQKINYWGGGLQRFFNIKIKNAAMYLIRLFLIVNKESNSYCTVLNML